MRELTLSEEEKLWSEARVILSSAERFADATHLTEMPDLGKMVQLMVQPLRVAATMLDARSQTLLADDLKSLLVAISLEAKRRYGPSVEFDYQAATDFVDAVMDLQTAPDAQMFLPSSGKFASFVWNNKYTVGVVALAVVAGGISLARSLETANQVRLDLEVIRSDAALEASWDPLVNAIWQSVERDGRIAESVTVAVNRDALAVSKMDHFSHAGGLSYFVDSAAKERVREMLEDDHEEAQYLGTLLLQTESDDPEERHFLKTLNPEALGQKYMDEYGPEGKAVKLDNGNMTAHFVADPNSANKALATAVKAKAQNLIAAHEATKYNGYVTSIMRRLQDEKESQKMWLEHKNTQIAALVLGPFAIPIINWMMLWRAGDIAIASGFFVVRAGLRGLYSIIYPKRDENSPQAQEKRRQASQLEAFKSDEALRALKELDKARLPLAARPQSAHAQKFPRQSRQQSLQQQGQLLLQ